MFWDNFYHLCELKNTTPNAVCKELNLSTATATHWKNGTIPKGDVLFNIANLLDCSVDYLLGRTNTPNSVQPPTPNPQDQMTTEMLKIFEKLSFKDKIAVLNYALNIETPPQRIVQTKAPEPQTFTVREVARNGQSGEKTLTKEYLDFIEANQETEDSEL